MNIPFSTEEFFQVIENYNRAMFPIQLVILLLAIAGIVLLFTKHSGSNRFNSGFLGFLWMWSGSVYHLIYFTEINKAAYLFGILFITQGALFFLESFGRNRIKLSIGRSPMHYLGYFFIIYGLVVYPFIEFLVEGTIFKTISLGLPCPTTILTFGVLMLTRGRIPGYLLIIPALWALIGVNAAFNFGVYQDVIMLVAALTALTSILASRKKNSDVESISG